MRNEWTSAAQIRTRMMMMMMIIIIIIIIGFHLNKFVRHTNTEGVLLTYFIIIFKRAYHSD